MNTILSEVLTGFTSVEWSSCPDALPKQPGSHVYVFVVEMGDLSFPLYVGQTNRLLGRFGDYQYASFQAPTDFRVGEACKFLRSQGATIHLFFRDPTFPLQDERLLQRGTGAGRFSAVELAQSIRPTRRQYRRRTPGIAEVL
jgi:hypothetical protein